MMDATEFVPASEISWGDIPTPRKIVARVALAHGLRESDLTGRSRAAHIFAARCEAIWLLRNRGMSLTAIGRQMGGRDHTTILNALRRMKWQEQ